MTQKSLSVTLFLLYFLQFFFVLRPLLNGNIILVFPIELNFLE